MSSKWELKEKSTGELVQKKAFNKIKKNINIPGFRKGQAPAALIKKQIPAQNILMDAVEAVANDVLSDGVEEHKLVLVDRPELRIDEINEEKVILKFICAVKPEVKLGDYKGLPIKKKATRVTQKDIDAEVERLQQRYADMVVKEEGNVESGDTAVIDFEGFKDGVAFDGGKAESYPLEIGSGAFIPGFEDQLIGMAKEETKDINVTFPENYQVAELAGQPVVFKVTVHEIKTRVLPEANDELIKEAKIKDVETMEDYRAYVKKNLSERKDRENEENFTNELLEKVVANAEVEIPDAMIERETDEMVREITQRLSAQGFTLEQFAQVTGQDEEKIRAEVRQDAEKKVRVRLVLEAVAEAEQFEISDEEIDAELKAIADQYSMQIEQVRNLISHDAVSYDLRQRKALELIKETAGK